MHRRSGQNGTVVVQDGWYRVRWRQDVRGREQRVQMSEKIAPAVFDKEGKPKPPSPNIRRKAREIVEKTKLFRAGRHLKNKPSSTWCKTNR